MKKNNTNLTICITFKISFFFGWFSWPEKCKLLVDDVFLIISVGKHSSNKANKETNYIPIRIQLLVITYSDVLVSSAHRRKKLTFLPQRTGTKKL